MLFLAAIFSTKLPSLTVLYNSLIPLICFMSLRTWQIFNTKYIIDIDDADPLVLGRLGAASLT